MQAHAEAALRQSAVTSPQGTGEDAEAEKEEEGEATRDHEHEHEHEGGFCHNATVAVSSPPPPDETAQQDPVWESPHAHKRLAAEHSRYECRAVLGPLLYDRVYRFLASQVRSGHPLTEETVARLRHIVRGDQAQLDACLRVQSILLLEEQMRAYEAEDAAGTVGDDMSGEDEERFPSGEGYASGFGDVAGRRRLRNGLQTPARSSLPELGGFARPTPRRPQSGGPMVQQARGGGESELMRPRSGRRRAHVERRPVAQPTPTNRPRSRDNNRPRSSLTPLL